VVRGCHTQGRTVEEASRRIIQALGLFVGNAHNATILDDVKLPPLKEWSPDSGTGCLLV
jgi:predicted RNase H-like HicB family nuclease